MARKVGIILLILMLLPLGTAAVSLPSGDEQLIEISSDASLKAYLENQTRWYQDLYARSYAEENQVDFAYAPAPLAASTSAPQLAKDSSGSAETYSSTNIQVQGVDEADYLKNDGKFLYILHNNDLVIAQVYPPDSGKIVSTTPVLGNPSGLFLQGDNLMVFSSEYASTWSMPKESGAKIPLQSDITHAVIYDVSDHSNPKVIRELTLPGTYDNGRMIGNRVYVLSRDSLYTSDPVMPIIIEGETVAARPTIWCPPIPMNQYTLNTLTSFDLTGKSEIKATSFLLSWDNTLYVSLDNAYLAYKKWSPYWWGWNWRSSMSGHTDDGEKSVIHRFSLSNGTISYEGTGTVPGYLLNQFSLDEYEGNLRVATTNERYLNNEWIQDNNVYVLSPELDIIGSLENLAKGEKIYSARFMGDLLYLVTFKQTDPLFVIDLSNPRQPGILGELKIPGYSDYLHPYDKTHLIGIGKDTTENEQGGVIPTGVKVALFDVSDLNNPRLLDTRIIGEKGSSSEVLNDHKAFLLDGNRSMIFLPVNEIIRIPITESKFPTSYTTASWKGTYLLGIDPKTGFIDKGKIEQEPMSPNDYYSSSSPVRRSVIMDDVVYTISDNRIIGSVIDNPDDQVLLIDLPEDST